MNNLQEISSFIDTIQLGEPVYNISAEYRSDLCMELEDWEARAELRTSDDWIENEIGRNLIRKFSPPLGKMILRDKDSILSSIRSRVYRLAVSMIMKTSPAEQPKRTKVYKEMKEIAYDERNNENFINDLIPVINYYYSHVVGSTDSTNYHVHKKNVFGLVDILRKKYGKSSN